VKKLILIGTAAALVVTGCATAKDNPNTTKGAGIGAAIGAVAGAVMDKQQKELEKIAETKRTEQGLITKLKSDILFDTGKADLKEAAKSNIMQLAAIMKKYPENVLTVKGYTDDTGAAMINNPLSQNRADAVRVQLVTAGIPAQTVTSIGMGSANPVDAGKTKEARAKNRRVEIEVTVDESKIPKT